MERGEDMAASDMTWEGGPEPSTVESSAESYTESLPAEDAGVKSRRIRWALILGVGAALAVGLLVLLRKRG